MLYRIVIKTKKGLIYYLTSDKDAPETDAKVNFEEIQFLSRLNPTHAHTFSTEELAKEVCKNLQYPYNEKSFVFPVDSVNTKIVSAIFYRVVRKEYNYDRILWANSDKSFTKDISSNTLLFTEQEEAEKFIQSLSGLKKRYSFIAKIKDYGEPDYKFDVEFIVNGKLTTDVRELPGIVKT